MKSLLQLAALALCLAVPSARAVGQTSIVLPAEYERAWGRGSSSALGNNSTRTQMIFASPFPVGTTVLGVGLRPTASTVDRASFTADIEVQLSSTTAVPGALSSTFASNIGTDMVVVLPRQIYTIPAMAANRSTGEFAQITFTTPFVFGLNGATNILVDLFVYGRSTGASWSTDRAFASASGRAATAGMGCGSATIGSTSSGGTYVAGATLDITLSGAQPASPAYLLLSFDQKDFAPGLPLPIPLALIGAGAGCDLLVNPSLGSFGFVTDGSGGASGSFPVPFGVGRFGLGWQWLHLGPASVANPLGLFTTASRATWIGPEVVVPGAQYVWDLSNVSSATGTSTTDSVPIVQFVTR